MSRLFGRQSDQTQEISITITASTFFRILALVIGTILLLTVLRKTSHALVLIATAMFLALALNAPVTWVSHHLPGRLSGRRGLATSIASFVVVLLLAGFIASLAPPVIRQTNTLITRAPSLIRDIHSSDSDIGRFIQRYHLQGRVEDFSAQLESKIKRYSAGSAVSTLSSIATSFISVLTILVLTFMMLVEGPRWVGFGRRLLPPQRREHVSRVSDDMYRVVKGYVNGQVMLALIAAILLLPGLLFFDVSYPVALMAVVFICGLIPMVGHTIGATIVTLVALFTSPVSAAGILLYYILYQQIENYLIQPRLQANATNMSPLLVFVSVVIGVSFGGLLGGLVAIPIAGCIRVLLIDYLESNELLTVAEKTTLTDRTR